MRRLRLYGSAQKFAAIVVIMGTQKEEKKIEHQRVHHVIHAE